MFDMEPVIESILSQLGAVADRRTLITSEKSESFAGSLLNFKGWLGSRAAGSVIFIQYIHGMEFESIL